MKLLKDYTKTELANITIEQKQKLYLLELADRGIKLPNATPHYISHPEKDESWIEDKTIYQLDETYGSSKLFTYDEDKAKALMEIINNHCIKVDYDYVNHDKKYYEKNESPKMEIKNTSLLSFNKYKEYEKEIQKYNKNLKQIKKSNEEREKIIGEQSEVMAEIDNKINEAFLLTTRVNELSKVFKSYLKISDNNKEIATKFLLNAHYQELAKYRELEENYLEKIGIESSDIDEFETKQNDSN